MLSQDHEACAGGNFLSSASAGGLIASAASARNTPWPIFSFVSEALILSVNFWALRNRAQRTASTRIHGCEYCLTRSQCSASQSAAVAAICGVAAEVPRPFMSTVFGQSICAHGTLGV